MDSVAAKDRREFGTGRLFLTDSRLVLAFLNTARYAVLQRLFGVSRRGGQSGHRSACPAPTSPWAGPRCGRRCSRSRGRTAARRRCSRRW